MKDQINPGSGSPTCFMAGGGVSRGLTDIRPAPHVLKSLLSWSPSLTEIFHRVTRALRAGPSPASGQDTIFNHLCSLTLHPIHTQPATFLPNSSPMRIKIVDLWPRSTVPLAGEGKGQSSRRAVRPVDTRPGPGHGGSSQSSLAAQPLLAGFFGKANLQGAAAVGPFGVLGKAPVFPGRAWLPSQASGSHFLRLLGRVQMWLTNKSQRGEAP